MSNTTVEVTKEEGFVNLCNSGHGWSKILIENHDRFFVAVKSEEEQSWNGLALKEHRKAWFCQKNDKIFLIVWLTLNVGQNQHPYLFFSLWLTFLEEYVSLAWFLTADFHHSNRFLQVQQYQCNAELTLLLCLFVVQGYSNLRNQNGFLHSTLSAIIHIFGLYLFFSYSCWYEQQPAVDCWLAWWLTRLMV